MLTEIFHLSPNGKVIPGVTVLLDTQTGQLFDVVSVVGGDAETGPRPFRGGSSAESCAIYGGLSGRDRQRRDLEVKRLNKARVISFPDRTVA